MIDLAGKTDTSLTQISHYISPDPALAVKIIKTANAPLYKSRYLINNINQCPRNIRCNCNRIALLAGGPTTRH
ncbi:HDOD domain-containing protein [Nitrosomonas sp. HPC101]|uniref:HDOD domain-containing protein n=1 Tax=Nitrosomonas sp. HPC101 TaxID=1658667 RepID=UPI0031F4D4C9